MMGKTHAGTGVIVGFGLAAAAGLPPAQAVFVAVTVGGFALAPDLDCAEATASRFLGPVSRLLSWLLRHASALAFRCTRTAHDRPSQGTHRHLSHTLGFGLVMGVLAWWTAGLSPWAVAGWIAFGLLAAGAALHVWVSVVGAAAAIAPVVLDHASLAMVCTGAQHWIGLAVALGCWTHLVGDAVTVSGVPMFWPLPLGPRGQHQTWYELHLLPSPIRLHTGKRFERRLVLPVVVAGCVLAAPGVAAHLLPLLEDVLGSARQVTAVGATGTAGGAR